MYIRTYRLIFHYQGSMNGVYLPNYKRQTMNGVPTRRDEYKIFEIAIKISTTQKLLESQTINFLLSYYFFFFLTKII